MIRTEDYESFYVFFANMTYTIQFQGFVGFGIKQLTPKEFNHFCAGGSTNTTFKSSDLGNLDVITPTNFTQTVSTRVILSGCYYIGKNTFLLNTTWVNRIYLNESIRCIEVTHQIFMTYEYIWYSMNILYRFLHR